MTQTSLTSAPPFELVAGHPLLDLVNTLDWRFRPSGPEDLLPTYADLLRFSEQSALLAPAQSQRLRRARGHSTSRVLTSARLLREAAAEILYASLDRRTPSPAALRTLDRSLSSARAEQELSWKNSHPVWHWKRPATDPALPLWLLSLSSLDLLTPATLGKLRSCDSPDCRWLFLDTSKNHTRRWCDMKLCGNRMKARRFKAQHTAS